MTYYLQCSHINGRAILSVRWHPLNANCLCAPCHGWFEHYRLAGTDWVQEFLGERKYMELMSIAKRLAKGITVADVVAVWQQYGVHPSYWEKLID